MSAKNSQILTTFATSKPNTSKMKDKNSNRSFATRLSRWVMLVLFIMMSALSILLFITMASLWISSMGDNFHGSMLSSNRCISDIMSDVNVAVDNNVFDIERHLSQPDQMQAIMERIVTQNPRIRSCGISFIENYYPQKGRSFCPYAWRNDSMEIKTQQIGGTIQNYLESEWFKEAIAKDSAYWSEPFLDGHNAQMPLVAYMRPIHDQKGRLVAILGADLSLDFITKIIEEQDSIFEEGVELVSGDTRSFQSFVIKRDGTFLTHPEKRRILKGNFFDHIKDGEPGWADTVIKNMKAGEKSKEETTHDLVINRKDSYLFYSPVTGKDWMLTVVLLEEPLTFYSLIIGTMLVIVVSFIVIVTFLVCRFTIKRTAKPLRKLAETADKVAQGDFGTPLPDIKHNDEISQLRDSFENMQQSLTSYVEELKDTTAAKASIENELKIAHDIQMSMLPKTYPAFPNRTDFDIFGQVTPAKAVGGDLYDFFMHDEKLFFCIGDVSGKGVPASLVMAVTRFLFRNIAAHTSEPSKIVTGLNEALCENNEASMFVTFFVGVLNLTNGNLCYSNAGHDMPLLIADGKVTIMACDPNIPVGVMGGWTFTSQQAVLKTGDTIFLYTDGLNEAENINHQQFGMGRVVQTAASALNKPTELITAMSEAVQQFVGEAEQSDDQTLFAIQYTNS